MVGKQTEVKRSTVRAGLAAVGFLFVGLTWNTATHAASATGSAAAIIVANLSAVSAVQNFEVGLPPQAAGGNQSDVQVNVPATSARQPRENLVRQSVSRPASFSVAGAPNQVFSVTMPSSATAITNGGEAVAFSNFQHDAGMTPTVGERGLSVFSVGATAQFNLSNAPLSTAASEFDQFGDLGDGLDVSVDQGVAGVEEASAGEIVPLRKVSAFGIIAASDGFMNVLISYN